MKDRGDQTTYRCVIYARKKCSNILELLILIAKQSLPRNINIIGSDREMHNDVKGSVETVPEIGNKRCKMSRDSKYRL